ncbi:YcxB family protein [Saccharopolyspora sp. NPDC050642]|uniref:YcxB family protein n=1 Tax=Saccharopolyspora sp. NPDC050642 TaxID=3157099 RepID=UPI003407F276
MSLEVPHDVHRLRRTIRFLSRPYVLLTRILGGVLAFLGVVLIVLDTSSAVGYAAAAGGLAVVFAIGPIMVAVGMRTQAAAIQHGYRLTLDDEWMHVAYPLVESRCRWEGLDRAVETPEAWYVMFGKAQAVVVPKDVMTPQQRAEFEAFVAARR